MFENNHYHATYFDCHYNMNYEMNVGTHIPYVFDNNI